jgi:hypothetical protein
MKKAGIILMGWLLAVSCAAVESEEREPSPRPKILEPTEPQPPLSHEEYRAKQEASQASFERADAETVRLPPKDFDDLTPVVIQELERRACTIPQAFTEKGRGNVIRGSFTTPGQIDLAVLCSRERVSSILVFRNSAVENVAEFARAPDKNYLQGIGGGEIGYSRALSPASREHILRHNGSNSPINARLDHSGIEDQFLEKGSTIWYWHDGEWLELPGAD